jgi:hypothetical protein
MDKTFKATDRYGAEIEFELIEPSLAVEREGEMQYRIAFSKALTLGILPREAMREVMREQMVWDKDDDEKMKEAMMELAASQAILEAAEKTNDDTACLQAAADLTEKRNRMWELFIVQQSSFTNSAEGYAEVVKGESIMAATTVIKATQERYWPTYAEYVEEREAVNGRSNVVTILLEKHNDLITEARDNILEDFPERRWLKDAKDRILESAAIEVAEAEMAKKVTEGRTKKAEADAKKAPARKKRPARKKAAARKKVEK